MPHNKLLPYGFPQLLSDQVTGISVLVLYALVNTALLPSSLVLLST